MRYRWRYQRSEPTWLQARWPYDMFDSVNLADAVTAQDVIERDMRTLAGIFWWLVANDEREEAGGDG